MVVAAVAPAVTSTNGVLFSRIHLKKSSNAYHVPSFIGSLRISMPPSFFHSIFVAPATPSTVSTPSAIAAPAAIHVASAAIGAPATPAATILHLRDHVISRRDAESR